MRDIGFKWRLDLERPLLGVEHDEKEMQTFSSTFGEKALLLDGFLRDIDSRNHAINPSRLEKNQTFIPPPSWGTTDDVTEKQIDRQIIKAPWNLQDTTYPFGDKWIIDLVQRAIPSRYMASRLRCSGMYWTVLPLYSVNNPYLPYLTGYRSRRGISCTPVF